MTPIIATLLATAALFILWLDWITTDTPARADVGTGSALLDRLAARLGQITALLLAYGLQTVSIALPAASEDALLNLLSAALYGGTFVGIVSLTLSIIGRHFPANPAKAMARMTLSYGVAQIVAPALAGYIATVTGSYRGALWLAAAVMLAGMAALAALREKPAHRP